MKTLMQRVANVLVVIALTPMLVVFGGMALLGEFAAPLVCLCLALLVVLGLTGNFFVK